MKTKKTMIDEMKKYNNALEKFLPNLDLHNFKDLNKGISGENETEEYFSLLANNLMELRTEVALTRKNLTSDIEGMVLKVINENQNKFFDQIKKFYGVIIMEMKENFSGHLKGLSDDLNNLKRKYNEIYIQNESFSNTLNEFVIDMKEISSTSEENERSLRELIHSNKKNFEELFENMEKLKLEIGRKTNSNEDTVSRLVKKINSFEKTLNESSIPKDFSYEYGNDKEDLKIEKAFLDEIDNITDTIIETKVKKGESNKEKKYNRLKEIDDKLNSLD